MKSHLLFFRSAIGIGLLFAETLVLSADTHIKSQAPAAGILILVDSTGDGMNMGSGNVCDDGTGHCTLRAAIQLVNGRNNGSDHIAISVTGTIALSNALPNLNVPVSIGGPGADNLTVENPNPQNTNAFRIFNVTTNGTVSFSGITIANGDVFSPTDYLGGGIQNYNAGIVNVTNCTLTANDAHQWFDQNGNVGPISPGGGIANRGGGTINITSSTFTENIADFGGGIYNSSTGIINVTNSTLSQNSSGSGGGIYNLGTITITDSTLHDNYCVGGGQSGRNGGGIYNFAGTVNLIRSTLGPSNTASGSNGGGIFNDDSGTVNVINSTIFLNTTDGNGFPGTGNGGGIYNKATLNVSNSTIALNILEGGTSPVSGCGIYNDSAGVATIKSSIIANNEFVTGADFGGGYDVYGSFNSQGYNLIGVINGGTGFTAPTDQTGSCTSQGFCDNALDPKFELDSNNSPALKDNGGPTQTIALVCGSPAMDKGTSNGLTGTLTTDQRGIGFARTVDDSGIPNASGGDGTDVGVFEFGAGPIMPTSVVSRKFHGSGNSPPYFDIPLPLSCGSMGIECRRNTSSDTSGPNAGHDHEIIVTFPSAVTVTEANVTGAGNGATATFSVSGKIVTVDLHSVPNAYRLTINLRGVSDGTNTGLVSIPMGVLLGDVNATGRTDSGDVTEVRNHTVSIPTLQTFRYDVNVSGRIDAGDVTVTRNASVSVLPP